MVVIDGGMISSIAFRWVGGRGHFYFSFYRASTGRSFSLHVSLSWYRAITAQPASQRCLGSPDVLLAARGGEHACFAGFGHRDRAVKGGG